jgi:hypothetical protein
MPWGAGLRESDYCSLGSPITCSGRSVVAARSHNGALVSLDARMQRQMLSDVVSG